MAGLICEDCSEDLSPYLRWCPHCARPSLFPNVIAASQPTNYEALKQRYDSAYNNIRLHDKLDKLRDLRELVETAEVCKAMPRWELDRLISSDTAMASTYYQQIDGRCRIPDTDEWDRLRRVADAQFFQAFGGDIHFASLSTGGRWLSNYGEGAVFFKSKMIAHRATVFETNTARWVQNNPSKLVVPPGHSSVWAHRYMICVAKLADQLCNKNATADLESLILSPGKSSGEDEFIEVHILGNFTLRSAKSVIVKRGALGDLGLASAVEKLPRLGIEFSVMP